MANANERKPCGVELVFKCRLDRCPVCGANLTTTLGGLYSRRRVLTMEGVVCVTVHSRSCTVPGCAAYKRRFLPIRDLLYSDPGMRTGWDVIGSILAMRDHDGLSFGAIREVLAFAGVVLDLSSIGRLYRRFRKMSRVDVVACKVEVRKTVDLLGCINLVVTSLPVAGSDSRLWLCYEGFGRALLGVLLIHKATESNLRSWLERIRARCGLIGRLGERDTEHDPVLLAVETVFGVHPVPIGGVMDTVDVRCTLDVGRGPYNMVGAVDVLVPVDGTTQPIYHYTDLGFDDAGMQGSDLGRLVRILERVRPLRTWSGGDLCANVAQPSEQGLVSRFYTVKRDRL